MLFINVLLFRSRTWPTWVWDPLRCSGSLAATYSINRCAIKLQINYFFNLPKILNLVFSFHGIFRCYKSVYITGSQSSFYPIWETKFCFVLRKLVTVSFRVWRTPPATRWPRGPTRGSWWSTRLPTTTRLLLALPTPPPTPPTPTPSPAPSSQGPLTRRRSPPCR